MKICALLVLSICAGYVTTSTIAWAAPVATGAALPELIFADDFETPPLTSAGPDAPWTKIVLPAIVLDVVGDPAGTLIVALPCFVTSGPVAIAAGDVLATAIGPKTPDGLLRRVISLTDCVDGRVLVTTEPATLSDALPAGTLVLSDDLSDMVVPDFEPTSEDGTIEPVPGPLTASAPTTAAGGAVGTVAEPGRFTLGCGDSGPKLKVKPVFSFDPEVTFSTDWGTDDEVHIQIGGSLQGEIGGEFSATGLVQCDAKFTFVDNFSLGKKLIFVGPLPVVVEPKLSLTAKLTGIAQVSLKTTASTTGSVGAVLNLDREPGFDEVIWDLQPSGSFNGSLTLNEAGKIEATLSLSPSIGFLLYGIVAPTAAVTSGLKPAFEPCLSPNLTLRQPASLDVSLKPVQWLGEMLQPLSAIDLQAGHTFNLPGSPYLLYGADVATTVPCVNETVLPDGMVGEAYSTALVIAMPPGAINPVYTVTAGSLPPGLQLTGDGLLEGTPTQSDIYHFDATATHSLGTSTDKFRITIQEAEALEITTTSLPGGTVGQEYSFALQANRPAGEVTWAVTGGDLPLGIALSTSGTLSGIPTEAGNYPITVEATHGISTQTAEKLFAIAVIEDIGGSVLGIDETGGEPSADVRPDGSTAVILWQDQVENPDEPWLEVYTRFRLVKAGPDGQIDFDVDIPGQCTQHVGCRITAAIDQKSSVRIMPDGGAAIAFLGDGSAFVARYAPNGDELWLQPIPSIGENYWITAFEVAPDGRIALAAFDGGEESGVYCPDIDRGFYSRGSSYVEFDAYGASIRAHEYLTEGSCQEAALGLETVSTAITGLAVNAGGNFVAVGYTAWETSGAPTYRPAEPFRIDLGSRQPLAVTDGKLPLGLAASGDGLFVALAPATENGNPGFTYVLGSLVDLTATTLAAPLVCAEGLRGTAGTPGSLFSMCYDNLERLSDAGALVLSRILPSPRLALAIVAGLGGQVFTVESRWNQDTGFYEIVGGVLNPDLSDPE